MITSPVQTMIVARGDGDVKLCPTKHGNKLLWNFRYGTAVSSCAKRSRHGSKTTVSRGAGPGPGIRASGANAKFRGATQQATIRTQRAGRAPVGLGRARAGIRVQG